MADEPSLTRWSFQDFKMFYDVKFGRKKAPEETDAAVNGETARVVHNGNSSTVASNGSTNSAVGLGDVIENSEQKILLPAFESAEMRTLAESLSRDIIRGNPDVKWESIKGLENAKRLLKEAVVMPIKYPKYFTGLLSPWKGILLFGPPGTGKFCLSLLDIMHLQLYFWMKLMPSLVNVVKDAVSMKQVGV
ncbi:hypothetical protein CsSME_00031284 [Camellia sinensis var. sinensis]